MMMIVTLFDLGSLRETLDFTFEINAKKKIGSVI